MFKQLIFLILLFNPGFLYAQDTLSVQQMREDIDFYFQQMENNHPRLYHPFSKAQIDSVRADLIAHCSMPMTIEEFYYFLFKTNYYKDTHSDMRWDKFMVLASESKRIPNILVQDSSIRFGSFNVVDINQINADELPRILEGMVSWEFNPQKRERIKTSYLLPLLQLKYQLEFPCRLTVEKEGKQECIVIEENDLLSEIQTYNPSSFYFTGDQNTSIAIFHCTTFNKDLKEYLKEFCETRFKGLNRMNYKYLFIDLTENGGGSDELHDVIFDYIVKRKFNYWYEQQISEFDFKNLVDSLLNENKNNPKNLRLIKKAMTKYESNDNFVKVDIKVKKSKAKDCFRGEVFVLMGSNTASAALDFCQVFKLGKLGLLIGETCSHKVNFAGNVRDISLPHSNIPFRYPTTFGRIQPVTNNINGFLEPDIWYDLNNTKKITISDCQEILRRVKKNTD